MQQQNQKVIYISTWGEPSNWDEASYVKDSKSGGSGNNEIRSFTSLSTYGDLDKKIILIAQDSILVPQGWDGNKYKNKAVDGCMRKLNINDQFKKILSSQSYEEYLNVVEKYVLCVAQEAVKEKEIEVIVTPAIGKFSGKLMGTKVICECGLLNNKGAGEYIPLSYIESLLAYSIYKKIKDLKEGDRVILDITYGINYLASLTLEVVKELTSLLNLEMRIIDYIPTDRSKNIYTYKEFTPLSNKKFDVTKIRVDNIVKKHVKALILSLQMGAILPILYICKKCDWKEIRYDEFFRRQAKIKENSNSQNTSSVINFSVEVNPIKDLEDSHIIWGDIIYDYVCKKVMNIKEDQDSFYSLDDIRSIVNSLSNFFSETTITIIENELEEIESSKYIKDGEEKMYDEARLKRKFNLSNKNEIRRHFIAHAGFLYRIVRIKKEKEKFFVKYYFDEKDYQQIFTNVYGSDVGQLLVDLINGNGQTKCGTNSPSQST